MSYVCVRARLRYQRVCCCVRADDVALPARVCVSESTCVHPRVFIYIQAHMCMRVRSGVCEWDGLEYSAGGRGCGQITWPDYLAMSVLCGLVFSSVIRVRSKP